jgi:feruloyl esterase
MPVFCFKMMNLSRFLAITVALSTVNAHPQSKDTHDNCNIEFFKSILPSNASILGTYHVPANGSFGQAADIAYPVNATNLPALCAAIVNVTSSATSSFTFGLFLPENWNQRFIAVGNGGFFPAASTGSLWDPLSLTALLLSQLPLGTTAQVKT